MSNTNFTDLLTILSIAKLRENNKQDVIDIIEICKRFGFNYPETATVFINLGFGYFEFSVSAIHFPTNFIFFDLDLKSIDLRAMFERGQK